MAFSQFPQWSCTTTGSSLNELWRGVAAAGLSGVRWSVLDRWPSHPAFISALANKIQQVTPPPPQQQQLQRVESGFGNERKHSCCCIAAAAADVAAAVALPAESCWRVRR